MRSGADVHADLVQLNVFKPVIIKNVLQSIRLLSDGENELLFIDDIDPRYNVECRSTFLHQELRSRHSGEREAHQCTDE